MYQALNHISWGNPLQSEINLSIPCNKSLIIRWWLGQDRVFHHDAGPGYSGHLTRSNSDAQNFLLGWGRGHTQTVLGCRLTSGLRDHHKSVTKYFALTDKSGHLWSSVSSRLQESHDFAIAMSSYPYDEPSLSVASKHSNQQLSGNVTPRHSSYSSSIVLLFAHLLIFSNQQAVNLCAVCKHSG